MKRLIIIVEGASEQEFVKSHLTPYLNKYSIYDVTPIEITTNRRLKSRGGFVNYEHLKNDVIKSLYEGSSIVTTFVDFFRIPTNCPGYTQIAADVAKMETAIDADINDTRFFAYIQLHEFEALLFTNQEGFKFIIDDETTLSEFEKISEQYPNPEDINNRPETAPSKRILNIHPEYDKVQDGNLAIDEIGFEAIMEKNPRFREWVEKIIGKMK